MNIKELAADIRTKNIRTPRYENDLYEAPTVDRLLDMIDKAHMEKDRVFPVVLHEKDLPIPIRGTYLFFPDNPKEPTLKEAAAAVLAAFDPRNSPEVRLCKDLEVALQREETP